MLRNSILLVFTAIAFTGVGLFSAPAVAAGRTVDLSNPEGILETIASLLHRHPRVLADQVSFRQDVAAVLKNAQTIARDLHLAESVFRIEDEYPGLSMRLEGGNSSYQPEKVEALRAELLKAYADVIKAAPAWKPRSLNETLADPAFKSDPKMAQKILKLLPWFVDSDGKAVKAPLEQRLKEATAAQMSAAYHDGYKFHLQEKVRAGGGFWNQAAEVFIRQFVEKTAQNALALKSAEGGETSKISLELIPPVVALLRGPIGYDCSGLSIPFFPLMPDTHVFWIRRSTELGGAPAGYIFVTMAEYKGRKIPYVTTVNGQSLDSLDTRAALVLAAKHFGVNELAVPDFEKNPAVVNDDRKARGMLGETKIRVRLTDVWGNLNNHELSQMQSGYDRYYDPDALSYAYLTRITENETAQFLATRKALKSVNPYPRQEIAKMSVFDRAILNANLDWRSARDYRAAIGLNAQQIAAGLAVMKLSDADAVPVESIHQWSITLELSVADMVAKLPLYARARTLSAFADRDWAAALAKKTADTLDGQLPELVRNHSRELMRRHREPRRALDIFAAAGGFPTDGQAFEKIEPDFVRRIKFTYDDLSQASIEDIRPYLNSATVDQLRELLELVGYARNPSPGMDEAVAFAMAHHSSEVRSSAYASVRSQAHALTFSKFPLPLLLNEPIEMQRKSPGEAHHLLARNGDFAGAEALATFNSASRELKRFIAEAYGVRFEVLDTKALAPPVPAIEDAIMRFIREEVGRRGMSAWVLRALQPLKNTHGEEIWEMFRPNFAKWAMKIDRLHEGLPIDESPWPEWFQPLAAALLLDGVESIRFTLEKQKDWSAPVWSAVEELIDHRYDTYRRRALWLLESRSRWTPVAWRKIFARVQKADSIKNGWAELSAVLKDRQVPSEFLPYLKKWRDELTPRVPRGHTYEDSLREELNRTIRRMTWRLCDEDLLGTGKRRWFFNKGR